MERKKIVPLLITVFLIFAQSGATACTGILLDNGKNFPFKEIVHGRTLEFSADIKPSIAYIPRKTLIEVKTGTERTYPTTFAMLGIIAFGNPLIVDGINEKGLGIGAFYFSKSAKYAQLTPENREKAFSAVDFPNWILSSFASVEEVKKAVFDNKEAVIVEAEIPGWENIDPLFHYVVYDARGNSITIEPLDGELVVRDNPYGAFTNDPSFDWHKINIRNYIALSPYVEESISLKGEKIEALGLGNGMFGLPGDFSSPSRFIRAWAYSEASPPFNSAKEGISMLFHMLNNFDIPPGITRVKTGEKKKEPDALEFTWLTVARDPQNLTLYYKTYADQTIRAVHMKSFYKNGKKILILKLDTKCADQPVVDMSDRLQKK